MGQSKLDNLDTVAI